MAPSALRSELDSSRDGLFARLRGLTEEQFRFVATGEDWSIATHLAHLLRIERLLCERASLALREDEPSIASTYALNDDEPGRAQRLAVPQIIHGMQASRRDLDALLAGCDDAAFARAGLHERLGRITVREMIEKVARHEREHTDDVAGLARLAQASRPVTIPLEQRPQ